MNLLMQSECPPQSPSEETLIGESVPPVVGVAHVVFNHEDSEFFVDNAIVDGEGKASHRVGTKVHFDQRP